MSRIGKKPIMVPDGVEIKIENGKVGVKGPKGELVRFFKPDISVKLEGRTLVLKPVKPDTDKGIRALWGTYASHIINMIEGVIKGFSKSLVIEGVGFRAQLDGRDLVLNLGFSHPVRKSIPPGIEIRVEKNKILVSGNDKELVGQTAAEIRALKKPEPYKGKGIRYEDEVVRRKAGKKSVSSAG